MTLEKILAISGKPGLYLLKVQTRTGFVAESMLDGKRIAVGLRSNVSLLSEISIYTHSEDRPLTEVMRAIAVKENEGPAISGKEDNDKLAAYFSQILPEYDSDRVYVSDIKKVLNWYNLLQSKGMVSKEEPAKVEEVSETESKADSDDKPAKSEKKAKDAPKEKTEKSGTKKAVAKKETKKAEPKKEKSATAKPKAKKPKES